MSRASFILLITIGVLCSTIIATKYPPKKCPPDQVWTTCGSACTPTCDEPDPICTKQCVERCQCKPGYVQNSLGKCICPSECPPKECPSKEYPPKEYPPKKYPPKESDGKSD